MNKLSLSTVIRILLFFFLFFGGLYLSKPFLVPVVFGVLLAMLLLPVCKWFEAKRVPRILAIILSMILFVGVIAGIVTLLSWQIAGIASDFSQIGDRLQGMVNGLEHYISNTLGISQQQQQELIKKQQQAVSGNAGGKLLSVVGSITGLLGNMLLVLVYIFLFMFSRTHLKKFILKLVPEDKKDKAQEVMQHSGKIAQQYIAGMGTLIACLWVMYSIGFSIVGVKHAFFFAILCGLLEIVPFVGNITGTTLTALMALTQGGGSSMVIGVLITYGTIQFIQSYMIQPVVVGGNVDINPLFTILIIILGDMIWGIPGMVLSVPLLGIAKIIMENVPELHPYAFLVSEEKKNKDDRGFMQKVKGWFKKKV